MKRSMKRKPLTERVANGRATRERSEARLIELAAETIPIGSGFTEYGEGRHCYVKANTFDGSLRCFRFRTLEAAHRAMAAGLAADEGHPYPNRGIC